MLKRIKNWLVISHIWETTVSFRNHHVIHHNHAIIIDCHCHVISDPIRLYLTSPTFIKSPWRHHRRHLDFAASHVTCAVLWPNPQRFPRPSAALLLRLVATHLAVVAPLVSPPNARMLGEIWGNYSIIFYPYKKSLRSQGLAVVLWAS